MGWFCLYSLLALRLLNTNRAAAGRKKTNHLPNKTLMGPLTVSTCLLIFEPWHREVFWTCAVRLFAHFPSQLQTGQTLLIQEIFSSLTKALEAHTHCVFVLFISLWRSGFIFVKIYTRARDWSDWRRHLFPHERAHLKRRSCDCLSWLQMVANQIKPDVLVVLDLFHSTGPADLLQLTMISTALSF